MSNLPNTLPSIQRITDPVNQKMDMEGFEIDLLHNQISSELEALAGMVGVTNSAVTSTLDHKVRVDLPASIAAAQAAAIAGAPVQSVAGRTGSVTLAVADVSGRAGGQTLIGGTGPSDALRLQGNASGAAELAVSSGSVAIGSGTPLTLLSPMQAFAEAKSNLINVQALVSDTGYRWSGEILSTKVDPTATETKSRFGSVRETYVPASNANVTANFYGDYLYTSLDGSGASGTFAGIYNSWLAKGSRQPSLIYGFLSTGTLSTTAALSTVYGGFSYTPYTGSGGITNLNALAGQTTVSGTGVVSRAWGTEGIVTLTGASSPKITTAIGVGSAISVAATGQITDCLGVSIGGTGDSWSNAGTITNCYPLFISSSTNIGTNKWSIYNESPAPSYFSGSIGAGVTNPSAKLHALSTNEQLRIGYDAANYASFTVNSGGNLKISQALTWVPPASITPASNGDLTVQATSNTSLTFKFKGSDGVVRSGSITLS